MQIRKLEESAQAQVQVEYSKVNKVANRILCEIFRETGFRNPWETSYAQGNNGRTQSIITEIAIILFATEKNKALFLTRYWMLLFNLASPRYTYIFFILDKNQAIEYQFTLHIYITRIWQYLANRATKSEQICEMNCICIKKL